MKIKTTTKAALLFLMLPLSSPVFADPPAQSGPVVIRYEGTVFPFGIPPIFIPDMKSGMSITVGIDTIGFCNGVFDLDLLSVKEIAIPEDANRINQQVSGTVRADVWPFTVFDCDLFLTVPPLASGYVDVRGTDNDLFVFLNPENNRNAFGLTGHGKLQDMWGNTRNTSFTYRVSWDGIDFDAGTEVVKVKLK